METMILLHFDQSEFNSRQQKLTAAKYAIQQAVDSLNTINNFKLDKQGLRDILYQRGETVASQFERAIDDDLIKSGAKSPTLRQLAKKGDMERFYAILNSFPKPESPVSQYISINQNGEVEISPESEQILREDCSRYIKTEQGLRMYEAQHKMVEAINEFMQVCPFINSMTLKSAYLSVYGESRVVAADLDYDRL